jgi:hypothetical protein
MIRLLLTAAREDGMRRFAVAASLAATLFVAVPGIASADPTKNVLPVQLTCGGETFSLVSPANGRPFAALYVGSTSVSVLMGVEGNFIPGFSEDDLTQCTAVLPDGTTFTAWVINTPRG